MFSILYYIVSGVLSKSNKCSGHQKADLLTKPLPPQQFEITKKEVGVAGEIEKCWINLNSKLPTFKDLVS